MDAPRPNSIHDLINLVLRELDISSHNAINSAELKRVLLRDYADRLSRAASGNLLQEIESAMRDISGRAPVNGKGYQSTKDVNGFEVLASCHDHGRARHPASCLAHSMTYQTRFSWKDGGLRP